MLVNTRLKYLTLIGNHIRKVDSKKELLNLPIKQKNEITYIANALNQMSEIILRAEEDEKTMILSLSHDLRTPLNNIIGYTQLIDEGKYDGEEELKTYIRHIKDKTHYLQLMVEEFFEMIRLSSGQYRLSQEYINVIELLKQILGEYMPIALQKKSIEFRLSISQEVDQWTYCYCDPMLVRRMFGNLFDNVLKYAELDSICEVGVNDIGEIYITNISKKKFDDGDLTYLFGKYTRGEEARTGDGFGLGLYTVGQILNLHRWSIRCVSEQGIFKVYIQ